MGGIYVFLYEWYLWYFWHTENINFEEVELRLILIVAGYVRTLSYYDASSKAVQM